MFSDIVSNILLIISIFCGVFMLAKAIAVIFKGVIHELKNNEEYYNFLKNKENKENEDFEKFNSIMKEGK